MKQETRKKCLLIISFAFLLISIGLQTIDSFSLDPYQIEYEYVNVKDMASAAVSTKEDIPTSPTGSVQDIMSLSLVMLPGVENANKLSANTSVPQEVALPLLNDTPVAQEINQIPRRVWYLPTEVGVVSQYPSYGHVAYDITSPRGTGETIFPVANGILSRIYTDSAGALVITVLHQIDGQNYTSQYAHLSRYAEGLYVGKEVTVNDALGQMGTTGYSTGVHLHFALVDCALFDNTDPNCSGLNGFFRYGRTRISQGFNSLGAVMEVPSRWESR